METNGGELLAADYVIAAIHPMRTMELLAGTNLIRPAFRHRINHIPQTTGGFSVYLRFKENAVPYMNYNFFNYNAGTPWGCEQYDEATWPKGYLYMHTCDTPNQQFAKAGTIISYMRAEELEAWKHTTVGHRGKDYEDFIDRRARGLIASLAKQFPGIRDNIAGFHVSSPLTYRDYTGTENGAIYGVAKDVALGSAGRVPHKTRIPNVFMAGQNINSHGMLGTIVGSIVVCSEFLTSGFLYRHILEAGK